MKRRHQCQCISELCGEILGYLAENPDARDTLEGVTHWWLLEFGIQKQAGRVKLALDRLVEEGLLLESQGPQPTVVYHVNPERWDAIRARLFESS